MIPDKNLFLVTSALRPLSGVWTPEQRFSQTIETIKTIKKMVPDSMILFTDVSVHPVPQMEKDIISNSCDFYYDLSQEPTTKQLSENRMQSAAETALLFNTLAHFKNEPRLKQVKRIFKVSGRSILEDGFNVDDHDHFGKFVFKTRIPTWMNPVQPEADHLLITRMYSFCPSLIDTYLTVLQQNMSLYNRMDFEHAHYANIPKKYLVELDRIYCWGWLSGGKIEHY